MKILSCYLLLAGLSLSMVSFAAVAESIPQVSAPLLCASDSDCDRDPKHLEQFVADFYKWYVASSEFTFSDTLHKLPHEEFLKRKREHQQQEDKILRERITPEFYAWIKSGFEKDGSMKENPKYCSPDVNFITCSQDTFPEWVTDTHAQLIASDAKSALILSYLPVPPTKTGQQHMPHIVAVRLRVVDGTWRIFGTERLATD